MKISASIIAAMSLLLVAPELPADDPPATPKTVKADAIALSDELTPDAQVIFDKLKASLDKDSEAMAMLDSIMEGETLGPEDGWFPLAKVQSRFGWQHVATHYDTNTDGTIQRAEFSGSDEDFSRLDRDRDGGVTEADFDWSKHSLTPTPGATLFYMADRDGNGKLTREEFTGLFDRFAGEDGEYLAMDDLRHELQPAPRSNEKRPDQPSRSTLVVGLSNQEVGSLQPGPNLDEVAPDFTLTSLTGEVVTLSKVVGDKPIVLIFGNFTCGPFRSHSGNLEKLYARYKDRAQFYLVYVREAHPSDGWWMQSNQRVGIDLSQPTDTATRRTVAETCQKRLELSVPFLVDTVDDKVGSTYSGMPNRLYLIDREGRIAFKNGRGPFGFHPRQLEQALVLLLNQSHKPLK